MARRFTEPRLVIASHNAGKVREIADLLAPFGVEVVSAKALGLPEPEEDGDSFVANALIKAEAAVEGSGLPALADDSGLEVSALGGAPGIHSARLAGMNRDFGAAMRHIEGELRGKADRTARFVCTLVLAWPGGDYETFDGTVEGRLIWPPRGKNGFGFDPMFQPNGHILTFGEMEPAAKHAISHRANAFRQMVAACFAR